MKGLNFIEGIDKIMEVGAFETLQNEFREKIVSAKTDDERASLQNELKIIQESRARLLEEERRTKELRESIIDEVKKMFV